MLELASAIAIECARNGALLVVVVAGFLARFTMILVILNFTWFIGDDGVMQ